jgi:undecaprenyl pyrophosphate phosphatase UppP
MTEREDSSNARRIVLGDLPQVNEVHLNVAQNVIVITEDKLRLHLGNTTKKMEKKNAWVAPLGILLAIILAFATADFRDFGLKASTWEAVFVIAAGLALLWLIWSIIQHSKSETVDDLIERIKKEPK